MSDLADLIARLELAPHPEGGWYRETWRAAPVDGARGAATSILFLLEAGQRSHWHRVDASELWIFQAGTPLTLSLAEGDGAGSAITSMKIGLDVAAGERPQQIVQPHQWQAAHADGGWCLVACVVAPAFDFAGFELAPPGWAPGVR